jgi:hypothetical protein
MSQKTTAEGAFSDSGILQTITQPEQFPAAQPPLSSGKEKKLKHSGHNGIRAVDEPGFDDSGTNAVAGHGFEGNGTPASEGPATADNGRNAAAVLSEATTEPEAQPDKSHAQGEPQIIRVRRYLEHRFELRINIVSDQIEFRPRGQGKVPFQPVNEANLLYELCAEGFRRGVKEDLKTLLASDHVRRFDPFQDYFDRLTPYDPMSEPDYLNDLAGYVITTQQEWWKRQFAMWMVRAVAQVLNRIDFNKQCLTLVGGQGDGKTSFLEHLVPPALKTYYMDGFDFADKKEGQRALSQNFLINLDELASFRRDELNNSFKAVLSTKSVRMRPLFQNNLTTLLRRASFMATTNQSDFLTDETGNVRWLVFRVLSINHDEGGPNGYCSVPMDRVWAMAYYLLNSNLYEFMMSRDDLTRQEGYNRAFIRQSTELELLSTRFVPAEKGESGAFFMTTSEITEEIQRGLSLRLHPNGVGRALKVLGFQETSNYRASLGYSPKGYFLRRI